MLVFVVVIVVVKRNKVRTHKHEACLAIIKLLFLLFILIEGFYASSKF